MKESPIKSIRFESSEANEPSSSTNEHAAKRSVFAQTSGGLSMRELEPSELRWVSGGAAEVPDAEPEKAVVWLV